MAKLAGIRKAVKWGGLAVCVLLAVVWVGSCWYSAGWETPGGGGFDVLGGRIGVGGSLGRLRCGDSGELRFGPLESYMSWWFARGQSSRGWYLVVPLWTPLLIIAGATAAAWRADTRARRRQRPAACPACGYDRRGLDVGNVCPECGADSRGEGMAKPDA